MTSENNVLHVFVLFCLVPFILCMCIFEVDSFPVHAAGTWTLSSNVGNHTLVVSHYYKNLFQQSTYSIPLDDSNYFYAVSFTGKKILMGGISLHYMLIKLVVLVLLSDILFRILV